MKTLFLCSLALVAVIGAGVADARPGLPKLRAAGDQPDQTDRSSPTLTPRKQAIAYGSDPLQVLDYYPAISTAAKAKGPSPLIVFVHGGGWKRGSKDNADGSWKAPHYAAAGYNYASINYRLVPDVTVEQQAADIVSAVRVLIERARAQGNGLQRIVLMGHSAGAHLVALVGTDERYLRQAGLSFRDLAGIVPIDGAAYDVPRQLTEGPRIMQRTYQQAFGTDPARQRALSPTLQAHSASIPPFLLIHVQRPDGIAQSKALEQALRHAGAKVDRHEFSGTGLQGHAQINRLLGKPDYEATPVVDTWLAGVFAR